MGDEVGERHREADLGLHSTEKSVLVISPLSPCLKSIHFACSACSVYQLISP